MNERDQWWKNPQGIVAVATVATMILGFFYVRERQMWDANAHITALENRGEAAIKRFDERMARMEEWFGSLKDQVNFLERKIDRLELKQAEKEKREASPPY